MGYKSKNIKDKRKKSYEEKFTYLEDKKFVETKERA